MNIYVWTYGLCDDEDTPLSRLFTECLVVIHWVRLSIWQKYNVSVNCIAYGVCVPERIRMYSMHTIACVGNSISHRMFIYRIFLTSSSVCKIVPSALRAFFSYLLITENADFSILNLKIFSVTLDYKLIILFI